MAPLESEWLLQAARELALARDLPTITGVVRRAARAMTGADGVAFVLREGDEVHYVDEDAISPLWAGRRFPADRCISGWAMRHREVVVIEDVYADDRVPIDAYRPTFVKSLAMVPVGRQDPIAAIGAYWARRHRATPREVRVLETLAGFAALAHANQELYAALRRDIAVRDEFLSVAAHELRSPIAALRLQIGMLMRRVEERREPPTRDALRRADRTAGRLATMVEKLLDVGRHVENRAKPDRTELDLAEVARSAVEALPGADAALVELETVPVHGRWDRLQLDQILQNLLTNALKFGAGRPVQVTVRAAGDDAVLVVRDHGIGISDEDRTRVFERFERAVSTRHYGGFGVGLWLVRRNAEAHGGRVSVESAVGEGSTFTVTLPRG